MKEEQNEPVSFVFGIVVLAALSLLGVISRKLNIPIQVTLTFTGSILLWGVLVYKWKTWIPAVKTTLIIFALGVTTLLVSLCVNYFVVNFFEFNVFHIVASALPAMLYYFWAAYKYEKGNKNST